MKRSFLLVCLIVVPLVFSLLSACGGGVGTCTCTCQCTTDNCVATGRDAPTSDDLIGDYTEDECDEAGKTGGNLCGGLSDGSTICVSSWDG